MWMKRKLLTLAVLAASCLSIAPATGQRQQLAMLDQLERGRWEIRLRDGTRRAYPVCVDNGRKLIQLRHDALACERTVISDTANEVTVQYTCRGRGYGRTSIRKETSQLVQIQSQGIAEGLPFDFAAEARRLGDCGA
jgi:hypothetical protein